MSYLCFLRDFLDSVTLIEVLNSHQSENVDPCLIPVTTGIGQQLNLLQRFYEWRISFYSSFEFKEWGMLISFNPEREKRKEEIDKKVY